MTTSPSVPARFVPTRQRHPGDAVGDLVIVCPWCRKTHRHGAGGDLAHLSYGHRAAHCDEKFSLAKARPGESRGYVLVPEAP